jgi:hypothetical protein
MGAQSYPARAVFGRDREHDSGLGHFARAAETDPRDIEFDHWALGERRLLMRSRTIVDATIIATRGPRL